MKYKTEIMIFAPMVTCIISGILIHIVPGGYSGTKMAFNLMVGVGTLYAIPFMIFIIAFFVGLIFRIGE